jgi:TonB family protein
VALKYDDFDLQIEPVGDKYRVRLNGPAGQAAADFVLPFTDVEVSNFLGRIGQVRRSTRRADAPELHAAKEFGSKLFNAVFSGELIAQLRGSVEQSLSNDRGLRIRLRLTDAPALADLPWEFLYDAAQNHFLTTSTETPLVRFLDLPQRITPLRATLPLRVLVVIAGPRNLKRLDAEGEWQRLQEALADLLRGGHIVLERLPAATIDALRLRARGAPFHIFHFIGHGGFDSVAEDGVLQFEDENGMSYPVRGEMLGMQLHDHRSLRLAVLNACEGARSSRQDPFSGVAQSLLQQRVPAVIAMQFEISDAAAKVFAREFYRAIAEGNPVDAAVCESRKALFNEEFGQEWATPVLYMRSQEGLLFELQAPATGVSDAKTNERERVDAERHAAELAEAERTAAADQERQAREKAEAQRQAAEKAEAERIAAADKKRQALEKAERERLVREKKEAERRAAERVEAEHAAAAEKERQAHEKTEQERLKREQAARETLGIEAATSAALPAVQTPTPPSPPRPHLPLWQVLLMTIPLAGLVLALSWHHLRPHTEEPRSPELHNAKGETLAAQKNLGGAPPERPETTPAKPDSGVAHSTAKPSDTDRREETSPPPAKTPPPAASPSRIRVSSSVQGEKIVIRVNPAYPPLAVQTRISGAVQLHAILAKDGTVQSLEVLSGHPLLLQSAIDAVKQWRYQPTFVNNQPVEVETTVSVIYTLQPPESPAPAPPAKQVPCTLGHVDFQDQGSILVGSVPFTYTGSAELQTLAVRGVPLKADRQPVSGLHLEQSTLKASSGTASFSMESHPSLGHAGEESEYVLVSVTLKNTGEMVCGQLVPYHRKW